MPTKIRTADEFLETRSEDEEHSQGGYDSEGEELRKGERASKRRRIELDEEEEEEDLEVEEEEEEFTKAVRETSHEGQNEGNLKETREEELERPIQDQGESVEDELPGVSKALSRKNLVATERAIKKSGVLWISRVPPGMKPSLLRTLLQVHGKINRIFLTPETHTSTSGKARSGGRKSYSDGWIEFVSKKEARQAAELLNARTIGGRPGSRFRDDIWNLVYLPKFKWQDLTREIAAENAERANRMRAELAKTKKEDRHFEGNVERAKKLEGMKEKREAKNKRKEEAADGDTFEKAEHIDTQKRHPPPTRQFNFKQNAVLPKKKVTEQSEDVKRVLSKIF